MRVAADIDMVLHGGHVLGGDGTGTPAEAIAIAGNRIAAIGRDDDILRLASPRSRRVCLQGRSVVPGLTDGHAHMDREGLRRHLPGFAGARSIADILDMLAQVVRETPPGAWIVTQPLGEAPDYPDPAASLREGRYPTRADLDKVSPLNPVYIRPIWGYWRNQAPLVSIANSLALSLAGIHRDTVSPSPDVTIERDADGEPDGVFSENTLVPIVEHTLMRAAPGFSLAQRVTGLRHGMRVYNAFGTTAVFEGHGAAGEVVDAYREVLRQGAPTVRATLTFSPHWGLNGTGDALALLREWSTWLKGDPVAEPWLRLQGFYGEIDNDRHNNPLRAGNHPCTGWAGFQSGAALPERALAVLLVEAARAGLRVAGIWPNLLPLFAAADNAHPIHELRWVLGHQPVLEPDTIARLRDLGIVVTTHTNRHIYKDGHLWAARRRERGLDDIVPLRALLDAGVPVAFGSDNLPVSLFGPIAHAVNRRSRTGEPVAPAQAISREEALTIATRGGAYLTFDEDRRGTLVPGHLADLAVLSADPLRCAPEDIADIHAQLTIVDGQIVHTGHPPGDCP